MDATESLSFIVCWQSSLDHEALRAAQLQVDSKAAASVATVALSDKIPDFGTIPTTATP